MSRSNVICDKHPDFKCHINHFYQYLTGIFQNNSGFYFIIHILSVFSP